MKLSASTARRRLPWMVIAALAVGVPAVPVWAAEPLAPVVEAPVPAVARAPQAPRAVQPAPARPVTALTGRIKLGGTTVHRDLGDHVEIEKTRRVELPWIAREGAGKKITVQESPTRVVKQTITDGAVNDAGRFVREIHTLTREAKPGATLPQPQNPMTPRWSADESRFLYSSKQLGPVYAKDTTVVRLFAPNNKEVQVVLESTGERIPMTPDAAGVWHADLKRAPSALFGKPYRFLVDGKAIDDPYAGAVQGPQGRSVFSDPKFDWHDQNFRAPAQRDLIVSEVHVQDETSQAPFVRPQDQGKFTGLGANGIANHYKDLGTAVELLPSQEYDRLLGGHWGYATNFFFAPTSRYASSGAAAPAGLKTAVDKLHQANVPVILDVVYNHTGGDDSIHFKVLGRDYYYRMSGPYLRNGSGVGNEVATENPMVQKLVIDSLRHFVDEYHVDGFRFDLAGLIDQKTFSKIDRALPKRIFLTGEPWSADGSGWHKGDDAISRTRMTVWNNDFRDDAHAFITGNGDSNKLLSGMFGSIYPYGFAKRPEDLKALGVQGAWHNQSMRYLGSHDHDGDAVGDTVIEKVGGDVGRAGLGMITLAAGQGPYMLEQHQETLRSKNGQLNTWNQETPVNWHGDGTATAFNDFTNKLNAMHKTFDAFRYPRPLTEKDLQVMPHANPSAAGFVVHPPPGIQGRKNQPDFLVLMNGDKRERKDPMSWEHFKLPPGSWQVVADSDTLQAVDVAMMAKGQGLRAASGEYAVPPGRGVVLVQMRNAAPAQH